MAALAFALLSPYALVHAPDFLQGVQTQLRYHYEDSVRAPASFCGLYGIRPSHGRISLEGARPLAASGSTSIPSQ